MLCSRTLFIHSKCNSSHLLTPICLAGSASQLNTQTLLGDAPGSQQPQPETPSPTPPHQRGRSHSALWPIQLLALNSNTVSLPRAGSPPALFTVLLPAFRTGPGTVFQPLIYLFIHSVSRDLSSSISIRCGMAFRLWGASSRALPLSAPVSVEGLRGQRGFCEEAIVPGAVETQRLRAVLPRVVPEDRQ